MPLPPKPISHAQRVIGQEQMQAQMKGLVAARADIREQAEETYGQDTEAVRFMEQIQTHIETLKIQISVHEALPHNPPTILDHIKIRLWRWATKDRFQ